MRFTPKERVYLHTAIARAIAWRDTTEYGRQMANKNATAALDAIEDMATSGSTAKRAVARLVDELQEAS